MDSHVQGNADSFGISAQAMAKPHFFRNEVIFAMMAINQHLPNVPRASYHCGIGIGKHNPFMVFLM
jgi:hypothetical protein